MRPLDRASRPSSTAFRANLSLRRRIPDPGVPMEEPMTEGTSAPVPVRILPNTSGNPAGKLADAEVIFGAVFDCRLRLSRIGLMRLRFNTCYREDRASGFDGSGRSIW